MTPRSDPPPVHTGHVRAYIKREPAKTRGTAQLILALCAEIDRLRAQQCADSWASSATQMAEQPSRVSPVASGGAEA